MSGHIDHIFYINLDKREDRKELMNCELEKYKLNAERFPAVFNPNNGLVGCGYSHLRVKSFIFKVLLSTHSITYQ